MKTVGKVITGIFAVIGFIGTVGAICCFTKKDEYLLEDNERDNPSPCCCCKGTSDK